MDFIIHGSEDSNDIDIHYLSDAPLTKKAAKAISDQSPDGNANVICVKDGIVVWTYKGSPDETNNGILRTYDLHDQYMPNPVTRVVDREVAVKVVRTIRGLLGVNTRSKHRPAIKAALHDPSLERRLQALERIDLTQLDFGDRDVRDSLKFIAFQIMQCWALIGNEEEIFTKSEASRYMPPGKTIHRPC